MSTPPQALDYISEALAALDMPQNAVVEASKLLDEHKDTLLLAYMRTTIADINCARGRLAFLQERLTQEASV